MPEGSIAVSSNSKGISGTRSAREGVESSTLALKLRLTLVALGTTPKDLCGRFAAVNRNTAFTPQNAYKWLSGKSAPRMSQVYSDWAHVLGGDLTGAFIAAASFEEFAGAISARYDIPSATLAELRQEATPVRKASPGTPSDRVQGSANQLLVGHYLAISPAWSRAQSGKLIRGQVEISLEGTSGLRLAYSETLFGRVFAMDGAVFCDGQTLQTTVKSPESTRCYFFALRVPSPPANLIGGMLSGSALHDIDARPVASRVLFIRDYSAIRKTYGNGFTYFEPSAALISNALIDLGYGPEDECLASAEHLRAFLMAEQLTGLMEAPLDSLGALGLLLDRLSPT
jgi:hypothetical protein